MKKTLRKILMLGGVLAVIVVGGVIYLTGGRYVATDNAYLKSAVVSVAPEISGPIAAVAVKDNQSVKKGDELFTVDQTPFKISLDLAAANEESARIQIEALKSRYLQKTEDLNIAQTEADYRQREFNRQKTLNAKKAASQSALDEAGRDLDTAKQRLTLLGQEQAEILANLGGKADIAAEDHPAWKAAKSAYDKAALDLARTTVHAPIDGTVAQAPDAGDYAHASVPSLNLIGTAGLWIDANFKETDLTRMKPGQPVAIKIDTYPTVKWTGKVESISPATGAEFSILPAQNATGNWVKVVQRVTVRIAIDHKPNDPPLRAGMSTVVKVDTGA